MISGTPSPSESTTSSIVVVAGVEVFPAESVCVIDTVSQSVGLGESIHDHEPSG